MTYPQEIKATNQSPRSSTRRRRAAARALAVGLCCLLPLVAAACATRPTALKPDDPLFGTWVNEEYEKLGRAASAKSVLFQDGRELGYTYIADTEPVSESQNTIEKTWIDSEGNHWYRIHWVGWSVADPEKKWEGFNLVKVSAAGTILESMFNRYGYPEELDPMDSAYGILYKQP